MTDPAAMVCAPMPRSFWLHAYRRAFAAAARKRGWDGGNIDAWLSEIAEQAWIYSPSGSLPGQVARQDILECEREQANA